MLARQVDIVFIASRLFNEECERMNMHICGDADFKWYNFAI